MTINRVEIEKYFSVGDVIPTRGEQSSFEIVEINSNISIRRYCGTPHVISYHRMNDIFIGSTNRNSSTYAAGLVIEYIKRKESRLFSSIYLQNEFELTVEKAKQYSPNERQVRLQNAQKKPEKVTSTSVLFKRNPDVVAEVLARANGICEQCKNSAPFIKKSNQTPYLEVHHIIRLADDGDDTVENAMALCPNCHRKAHFG